MVVAGAECLQSTTRHCTVMWLASITRRSPAAFDRIILRTAVLAEVMSELLCVVSPQDNKCPLYDKSDPIRGRAAGRPLHRVFVHAPSDLQGQSLVLLKHAPGGVTGGRYFNHGA